MDNLKIKKIWSDDDLFELRIEACSEFVSACKSQYKYVQKVENKNVQLLHSVIALTFKKSLFVFKPI